MTISEVPLFLSGEVIGTATVSVEEGQAKAVELTLETMLVIRNSFFEYIKTVLLECKKRNLDDRATLGVLSESALVNEMVKMADESFLAGHNTCLDTVIEILDKLMEFKPKEE